MGWYQFQWAYGTLVANWGTLAEPPEVNSKGPVALARLRPIQ
jgi:hypothetical protein